MGTKLWTRGIGVLALAVALPTGSLQGQDTSLAHAARIEAEAESMLGHMKEWKNAAELLRQAAALRPEGDPAAVKNLLQAAKLTYYGGDEDGALREFERIGERALNEGDVLTAANVFADAAWIASDRNQPGKALELAARVERLAFSPLLNDAQRTQLRDRFHGSTIGN